MDTIGERLRWARDRAGYKKPGDAADSMGIPRPTYYSHENNSRAPERPTAIRYAQKFKVRLDWLLSGRGSPTTDEDPLLADIHQLPEDGQRQVREFVDFLKSRQR